MMICVFCTYECKLDKDILDFLTTQDFAMRKETLVLMLVQHSHLVFCCGESDYLFRHGSCVFFSYSPAGLHHLLYSPDGPLKSRC